MMDLLTQLMKYAVPIVVNLLAYDSERDTLFGDNRASLWCFVAAMAVYWLVMGATKQGMGEKWDERLRRAALAFGVLSVISLMSMFLPYPASMLPLLVWVLLAPLLTWPKASRWIRRRITTVVGLIRAAVARARGLVSANKPPPPILPV